VDTVYSIRKPDNPFFSQEREAVGGNGVAAGGFD
jgi:hypothetical protein